jgi:polyhydroxyalkanoate synthesis regulator phasin
LKSTKRAVRKKSFFYTNFKDSTTEAKKDKTDNITERIRQLEEKYEKLQNSSRKLAESVVSGEFSKDEAKSLLTKMEE